jgi:hypothetical protein
MQENVQFWDVRFHSWQEVQTWPPNIFFSFVIFNSDKFFYQNFSKVTGKTRANLSFFDLTSFPRFVVKYFLFLLFIISFE